jgi:hypothetical protein
MNISESTENYSENKRPIKNIRAKLKTALAGNQMNKSSEISDRMNSSIVSSDKREESIEKKGK